MGLDVGNGIKKGKNVGEEGQDGRERERRRGRG